MKRKNRIIISLIIGFVVAMVIMAVAIYFQYKNAYTLLDEGSYENYFVKIFGIDVYNLIWDTDHFEGVSVGVNMGIVCAIFMAVTAFIEEIIWKIRHKRNEQK